MFNQVFVEQGCSILSDLQSEPLGFFRVRLAGLRLPSRIMRPDRDLAGRASSAIAPALPYLLHPCSRAFQPSIFIPENRPGPHNSLGG
jgi:hypothetical protein